MTTDTANDHAAEKDAELHSHGDTHGHGSMRDYLTGFGLSVVLTAIPFWLVMSGIIPDKQVAAITVMVFAMVQIVVHMIYFLHMDTRSEGGWTMMALIFTVVIVVITLAGSLWVMYHLNTNMMPMSPMDMGGEDMRGMP